MSKKKALYIDIDGTLARFHDADKMFIEAMWTQGFYVGLKPFENLVEAVRLFKEQNPDVEVFTLSAVLDTDPPFVVGEKNEWLDRYLPVIDNEHRIFTRAGEDKSSYIDMEAYECTLLDDYNKNLYEFEAAGGHAIKFHNDVNHRGLGEFGGSKGNLWAGDIVHHYDLPEKICMDLEELILGKGKDEKENALDFEEDKNKDFVIEDGVLVEYLGHEETVVIPDGIWEIGINAFWNNQELKHVIFPESVERIAAGAFAGVNLEQLILPKNLLEIGRGAFEGCNSLEYVRIPASVYGLSVRAFNCCKNLKSIEVDKGNRHFFNQDGAVFKRYSGSDGVFYLHRCPTGLSGEVVFEKKFDIITQSAFENCDKVVVVKLPDGVRGIHNDAFFGCSALEHIVLPQSVEHLRDSVFAQCHNLKSVVMPDNLGYMGERIFDGCYNLEEIVISDKALVDYCEHFNFLDEVFMLPCFEGLSVRYEALVKERDALQFGVDEVLSNAKERAGNSKISSNERDFDIYS